MSRIRRLINSSSGKTTLAAVGIGAGLAMHRSELPQTAFDAMSDVLLGDPQADRAVMGTDMSFGSMFALNTVPGLHNLIPPLPLINSTMIGNAFRKPPTLDDNWSPEKRISISGRAASEDYNTQTFAENPVPGRRRMSTPDGSMVFGMYNGRIG